MGGLGENFMITVLRIIGTYWYTAIDRNSGEREFPVKILDKREFRLCSGRGVLRLSSGTGPVPV